MKSYAERHGKINNANTQGEQTREKKTGPKATIKITPAEMSGVVKTKLVSTNQINQLVFNIFRNTCPEVEGVWIDVNGMGVTCDVCIAEHQEMNVASMENVIPLIRRKGESKTSGPMSVINRFNARNKSSNFYELTEEGQDALTPFINRSVFIGDFKDNRIDWRRVVSEICETDIYNRTHRYLKVSLDINRVLQAIYGKTSKNGEEYLYCVSPARPLIQQTAQNGNIITSSWIYSITQLNNNTLSEIIAESGIGGSTVGSINMFRG